MLTTKYVRDHLEEIRASLKRRESDYPLDELLDLDEEYRKLQKQVQDLRTKRNKGSEEISRLKKEGIEAGNEKVNELAETRKRIEGLEKTGEEFGQRIGLLLWNMPNVLHDSVPSGRDETGNVVVRQHGEPRQRKIPGHEEILRKLGLVELDQAAKVSGARFYYLKGDLVLLEQALIRFSIDLLSKKGYQPIAPPFMLKKEYYKGTTALGDFEETLYRVGDTKEAEASQNLERMDEELFLIATSEHVIAAMNAGALFSGKELPKKYLGISPCFRREAGSHGKDSKGIFRVHQFYKIEQFVVSRQDDSWKMLEELIANAEELWQKLKIPYRVLNMCTGDIGVVAAKKYDIEAYMPAQGRYREVVSCSNCTDWQSLRLDIRYDEGERKYVHTLNSTAIATTRALVAIVENCYDEKTGKVKVPDVLVQYMNGKKEIG